MCTSAFFFFAEYSSVVCWFPSSVFRVDKQGSVVSDGDSPRDRAIVSEWNKDWWRMADDGGHVAWCDELTKHGCFPTSPAGGIHNPLYYSYGVGWYHTLLQLISSLISGVAPDWQCSDKGWLWGYENDLDTRQNTNPQPGPLHKEHQSRSK